MKNERLMFLVLVKIIFDDNAPQELVEKLKHIVSNVEVYGNLILFECNNEMEAVMISSAMFKKYSAKDIVTYRTLYSQRILEENVDI